MAKFRGKKRYLLGGMFALASLPLAISITSAIFTVASTLYGYQLLEKGRSEIVQEPKKALETFRHASQVLEKPITLLKASDAVSQSLLVFPPFSWSLDLNRAAFNLSNAGKTTAELISNYPQVEKSSDINALLSSQSTTLFHWLDENQTTLQHLSQQIEAAQQSLTQVPTWLALHHRSQLVEATYQLGLVNEKLPRVIQLLDQVHLLAGSQDAAPHTFLLLFQNNYELRSTGGFIGSYATITASSGILRKFTFGENIYTIDKRIKQPGAAPFPINGMIPTLFFRDSNSMEGFLPDAAMEVQKLFVATGEAKPDGIIFLDVSILEDILRIIGPIQLPNTSQVVNAESIAAALNTYTEQTYFESDENIAKNRPKDILADVIPILLEKLLEEPNASHEFLSTIPGIIQRKSLQFWTQEPATEQNLQTLMPTDKPIQNQLWIKIVNNNLGGRKSSREVYQTVGLEKKGQELHLQITRSYTRTSPQSYNNRNATDVYLPAGSIIVTPPIPHSGDPEVPNEYHVTSTAQFTRISFWSTTNIGDTTTYTLRITLPANTNTENIFLFKQAGATNETYNTSKQTLTLHQNSLISL